MSMNLSVSNICRGSPELSFAFLSWISTVRNYKYLKNLSPRQRLPLQHKWSLSTWALSRKKTLLISEILWETSIEYCHLGVLLIHFSPKEKKCHVRYCQWSPSSLTQWGRETHIGVNNLVIIGSHNGLSHVHRQAIIWSNAVLLSIAPLETNFSKTVFKIIKFSFKKMHWKMSSGEKCWPFCFSLNALSACYGLISTGTLSSKELQWLDKDERVPG